MVGYKEKGSLVLLCCSVCGIGPKEKRQAFELVLLQSIIRESNHNREEVHYDAFYLLDVGTGNALVLYNEQLKIRAQGKEYKRWNLTQFKLQLILDLVGKSDNALFSGSNEDEVLEHSICVVPIPGDGRRVKCAYCGLMTRGECRTRYMCAACGVPLCSMDSGKVSYDSLTEAHQTQQDRIEMVQKKHQSSTDANEKFAAKQEIKVCVYIRMK
jgi:hypothetical protein